MKKFILVFTALIGFTACSDLTDQNDNPKRSEVAPAGSLLASAEKSLLDGLSNSNVNRNIFRLIMQQWTETTYVNESRYQLTRRNVPDQWWNTLYRDVIRDLREAKSISAEDPDITDEVRANQFAIAELLEIYTWALLVDTFGDVPFDDAMKIDENVQPAYNDDAYIYDQLIGRLDETIDHLTANIGKESWGTSDLIYEGDIAKWVKLANSIKLRMGMMLADADEITAQNMVEEAYAAGVFESNEDNAIFYYKAAPPNTNPIWVDLVQSNRKDFVAANTMINAMTGLDDPRLPVYYTTVDTIEYNDDGDPIATYTVYYGAPPGVVSVFSSYSSASKDVILQPDLPGVLMDYSEVEFYLAEAAERGFAVGDPAAVHYEAAIVASMEYWGVSNTDIVAYLGQPEVAYGTAEGGNNMHAIAMQKWIALYNRGFEAWTEWRRLDYPVLVKAYRASSEIPIRYTYPVSEQNVNTKNYNDAAKALGEQGDAVTTHVFWDED